LKGFTHGNVSSDVGFLPLAGVLGPPGEEVDEPYIR
jgi:hypothetical protein